MYHMLKCFLTSFWYSYWSYSYWQHKIMWNGIIYTMDISSCFGPLWPKHPKSLCTLLIYSYLILISLNLIFLLQVNCSTSHVIHYFGIYTFNILNLSKLAFRKHLLSLRKTKTYLWKLFYSLETPESDSLYYIGKIIKIWRQLKLIFYKLRHKQKHPNLLVVKTLSAPFAFLKLLESRRFGNTQNRNLHLITLNILFHIWC